MSSLVIIGGGMCGHLTGALLARDGHDITILERDVGPPPADIEGAWSSWERPGVAQFRVGHYFLARFHHDLRNELPEVAEALESAGALTQNAIEMNPDVVTGGWRPGDERFTTLTGRRPMVESTVAHSVAALPGVTVRRGAAVTGLLTTPTTEAEGPMHVVGVELENGEELHADLVIDASGRNSALPRLLEKAGGRAPAEERDDSGFVYYGRSFRSDDGTLPPIIGGGLQHYDSVSTLTLAADHGSWFCALVASGADKEMRKVRDPDVFERVWRSYPLVAHWHDAEPDGDVGAMAGIEDRIRHFVVDGEPVATGVVAVGDAWACTNPSVGRGASIGLVHSIALRDHIREVPLSDPARFGVSWDQRTDETVRPWYDDTLDGDRDRLAQIDCQRAGTEHQIENPLVRAFEALPGVMIGDGDLLRHFLDNFMLFRTKEDLFADQDLLDRLLAASGTAEDPPGPDRASLVALLST